MSGPEATYSLNIVTNKPKSKERASMFLVTINTNKSYHGAESYESLKSLEARFKDIAENLFSPQNSVHLLQDIGRPGSRLAANPIPASRSQNIKSIDSKVQIEANTDGRAFLHLHALIKVVHQTRVRVNLPLLKRIVYKRLDPEWDAKNNPSGGKFRPYINVRGMKNASFNLENYVNTI